MKVWIKMKKETVKEKKETKIRKKNLEILRYCYFFQVYFLIYNTDYRCNISLCMKVWIKMKKETIKEKKGT